MKCRGKKAFKKTPNKPQNKQNKKTQHVNRGERKVVIDFCMLSAVWTF